jgi:hypothetical protein
MSGPDGLRVLATTWPVVEQARSVRIVPEAVERLAERLAAAPVERPSWRVLPHWWDESDLTAQYVFVLDTLNFSFWGEPKWRVEYRGRWYDGYWALAAALRRAIEDAHGILNAEGMVNVGPSDLAWIFAGEGELPLLAARATALQEAGWWLLRHWEGSFANAVRAAGGSAVALVERLAGELSSYRDVVRWRGREVRFLKRAQLLVADLFGAYEGRGLGAFSDLEQLTAFADYKVPQVLRELGVLEYGPELAAAIAAGQELWYGSDWEVEIRATTVWAVERLRQALAARGVALRAFELDWYLWSAAQGMRFQHPYHRTRSIFY